MADIDCKFTKAEWDEKEAAMKMDLIKERDMLLAKKLQDEKAKIRPIEDEKARIAYEVLNTDLLCHACYHTYKASDRHNCHEGIVARVERIEGLLGLTPLKRGEE